MTFPRKHVLRRVPALVARGFVVAAATLGGFGLGVVLTAPYYGVGGLPLAFLAGRSAVRRLNELQGRNGSRSLQPVSHALMWAAAAAAVVVVITVLLHRSDRIAGWQSVLTIAAAASLIPAAFAVRRRQRRWPTYGAAAALMYLVALATYPIGGLGYLVPAFLLAVAAGIEASGLRLGTGGRSAEGLIRVAVALNLAIAVAVVLGRTFFAPPGPTELVGNTARAAVLALPAVLALWSRHGDPRLLHAAGLTAFAPAVSWVVVLPGITWGADPAPGLTEAIFLLLCAPLYLLAWERVRIDARAPAHASWGIAVLALVGAAALQATREMGCHGTQCTDDFVSTPEGLVGLVLVAAALGAGRLVGRSRMVPA